MRLKIGSPPTESKKVSRTTLTLEEVKASFEGTIPRVSVSIFYRLALLLAAMVMVLLPLVYLGCVCLAIWALHWYAVTNTALVYSDENYRTGTRILLTLAYFAPLATGPFMILIMLKPFFANHVYLAAIRIYSI